MTTTNPHRVEVHTEPDPDEPEQRRVSHVVFTCTAPEDATCRTYPNCGDETFDCGHPDVPGQECWVKGWFDNDAAVYGGEDRDDMRDDGVPAEDDRGSITVTFEGDYIEWDWDSRAFVQEQLEVSR